MNELSIWLNKDKDALFCGDMAKLILENLQVQVAKDLGLELEELEPSPENLWRAIGQTTHLLWSTQDRSLKQLLYSIDIDEAQLMQQLSGKPMNAQINELTEAIFERELRKVLTRLYFSGKLG